MALQAYSIGTASVATGDEQIAGTGTMWDLVKADDAFVDKATGNWVLIKDVIDGTHLSIEKWPHAPVDGEYVIVYRSILRLEGGQAWLDVERLLASLKVNGLIYLVGPDEAAPPVGDGREGQYARQPSTGKEWQYTGGEWVFVGISQPLGPIDVWDSATTYHVNSFVMSAGSAYVGRADSLNKQPADNPTEWQLLSSKGDKGDTGDDGTDGVNGAAATIAVGTVTSLPYGTPAIVENVGTANAAVFDIGIPKGQNGTGTGDMQGVNNLSELTDKDTALTNLGGTAAGKAIFKAADVVAVRSLLSSASYLALAFNNAALNPAANTSQELGTTGATLANNTAKYVADQWDCKYKNTGAVVTGGQVVLGSAYIPAIPGFQCAVQMNPITALSSLVSGDFARYRQMIEGYRIAPWGWGAAGASPIVVAGILFAYTTGVAFVKLSNNNQSRCYYHEMPVVSGPNFFAFVVPGDTSGTWATQTGVGLTFELYTAGKETTPVSTLDAWGATNKVQTTNSTNLLSSNNFATGLVGLYIAAGSQLPTAEDLPRLMRPADVELPLCQRFLEYSSTRALMFTGTVGPGVAYSVSSNFKVTKRVTPTMSYTLVSQVWFGGTFPSASYPEVNGICIDQATTVGSLQSDAYFVGGYKADARFGL